MYNIDEFYDNKFNNDNLYTIQYDYYAAATTKLC